MAARAESALPALQIARMRGAGGVVTARGTRRSGRCALALGAEHAFDSAPGASSTGDAGDGREGRVGVLNSLAGEAMERSLGLLRPFGRFMELGKRDYLADTPVGLRPFRRNLSYFGVDLDQLLAARPDVSRQLFDDVMALFASGELRPLPYTAFEHDEIVDAMRLMQQSGHIGKILVRPPRPGAVRRRPGHVADVPRRPRPNASHHRRPRRLRARDRRVARGSRRSSSGPRRPVRRIERQRGAAVAALASRGVDVRVAALDVSDRQATERFLAGLAADMPPLAGVMHAAMTLDDATVANLDEARLLKVLKPKIAGAEILDRLTRSMPLDYFVLFSSATTAIGNPGQGAYVAANGFLEGLAGNAGPPACLRSRSAGARSRTSAWSRETARHASRSRIAPARWDSRREPRSTRWARRSWTRISARASSSRT